MVITQLITVPLTDDFGFHTDPEVIYGGKVVVGGGCDDDYDTKVVVFVGGQRAMLSRDEARELCDWLSETLHAYDVADSWE